MILTLTLIEGLMRDAMGNVSPVWGMGRQSTEMPGLVDASGQARRNVKSGDARMLIASGAVLEVLDDPNTVYEV